MAETFKYLYLIFADDEDIGIPMDDYVLTTEAHLVPLHIQLFSNEMVRKLFCFSITNYSQRGSLVTWLNGANFERVFVNRQH